MSGQQVESRVHEAMHPEVEAEIVARSKDHKSQWERKPKGMSVAAWHRLRAS